MADADADADNQAQAQAWNQNLRLRDFLPDTYLPKHDCCGFILKLEDYFELHQTPEANKVDVFKACLSPNVRLWFDTLPQADRADFEHCRTAFLQKYLNIETRERAMSQFNQAQLQPNETISEFHKPIVHYANVFNMGQDNDYIKEKLLTVVPPSVREMLTLTNQDLNQEELVERLTQYQHLRSSQPVVNPHNFATSMPTSDQVALLTNMLAQTQISQPTNQHMYATMAKTQASIANPRRCFTCGDTTHLAAECDFGKGLMEMQRKLHESINELTKGLKTHMVRSTSDRSRSRSKSNYRNRSQSSDNRDQSSKRSQDSRSNSKKRSETRDRSRSKSQHRSKSRHNANSNPRSQNPNVVYVTMPHMLQYPQVQYAPTPPIPSDPGQGKQGGNENKTQ